MKEILHYLTDLLLCTVRSTNLPHVEDRDTVFDFSTSTGSHQVGAILPMLLQHLLDLGTRLDVVEPFAHLNSVLPHVAFGDHADLAE